MTNELQYVARDPLSPMILTLAGLWLISLCISVISISMALIRIAKRQSVRLLANLNILTGTVLGLCSVATVLWMFERVVEIRMTSEMTPSMSKMMVYYWTTPITKLATSGIIFGINLVIGIVLYMKWRAPHPPPSFNGAISAVHEG